jgi:hypothetical protein
VHGMHSRGHSVHGVHVDDVPAFVEQERVPGQARVAFAALGIQDPERCGPAGRPVPVVGDEGLGLLTDDVAAEPDPRPASELEPDAGRLVHCGREATAEPGGIEHEQQRLGAPGERGESMESVGDPRRRVRAREATAGQVKDEEVDGAPGQERPGDRQPLVEALGRDDDEPLEPDPAGDRLDRVEAARQVEPGDDGPGGLGFRSDPQGEGRPAARPVAADGDARRARQPAGAQDGIERREARADDPLVGQRGRGRRGTVRSRRRGGRQGQGAEDPRSCRSPASLEARQGGIHISAGGRHRTARLEHPF